ncbi:unnamed protein product, partial [Heligmosomoides polygyrus]|uniref:Reverse transcriptase domain-containing protein n=1 Tax=Heligmosomoides polygyrus TaxID=6339 RepID=A0A183GCR0_HELPZ
IIDWRIRDIVQLSTNQCGFVAGCGIVDAIHTVRLLIEKHREKRKPVHLAFLDLEKDFDRVARELIWYALREPGVPEELIEWVRILYSSLQGVECKLQQKTECMTTDEDESSFIKVNGIELPRTSVFQYLGSAMASDGGLLVEVNSRVNAAWSKRRSLTKVLCDKKIPERLKSKIYRAVVRPVAIYGAECWPVTKEIEGHLSAIETKMLRGQPKLRVWIEHATTPYGRASVSPRYLRRCAKLVCDGTATSFAQIMTLPKEWS